MKKKNLFKIVTLLFFTIFSINLGAQTTIYSENFSDQNDKGAVGPTPTTDLTGVDWTIDISAADLSATSDWFKVTAEVFEARDIDGNSIWLSPSININGFTGVSFSLSAAESGTMEAADIFNTEYRIDGGAWTAAATNGTLNDDFTSATVSQTGLSGATLELRVTMNNNSGTEYHRLDDILVQGTAPTDPIIGFDTATSTETETNTTFNVSIPVSVTNHDGNQIDVSIASSGTAEPADFTLNTTTLSFTSDGTQNISLDINPDTNDFDDETIILTLTETSAVTGLIISESTHTVTVSDDETPPNIGFDSATSSENETDATFTSANIPISVSNYSGTQIDIDITVTGGTAEVGDYTFTSPTSFSFTGNTTDNLTFSINDDADTDDETIIFTITETSAVTGLVISQATHTTTIIDDEIPPMPTAGNVFITEVLDSDVGFNNDYLELFNNSSESVSLSTSKLIRMSSGGTVEYVYDFGTDESNTSLDLTIPAFGFIIISRGSNRADYNTAFGITLPVSVNFNSGNTNLFFGSGRRWALKVGGTADTDDGTLIDDTLTGVGSSKDYRNIFTNTFISGSANDGTPGELEYLVYNGGNWINSVALDATTGTKDAYIYDALTLSANTEINDLGIASGGSLTINSGNSLIVNGTSSGNVTYQVTANDTNWHLLSSPVVGAMYDGTWIADNDIDDTTGSGTNIAISTYSNGVDADGDWTYATDAANSGTFATAQGYSIKRDATTNAYISFSGTIKTDNLTSSIDQNLNNWNLKGNPYTSYILVSDLISDNAANLTDTHEMVYVWDGSAYTALSGTDYIHPGQGFFVNADNSSADNFTIDASKLSAQTGVTLYKGTSEMAISLGMTDGTAHTSTKIIYQEGKSKGLDPRFDIGTFTGVSTAFSVYSHLVNDSQGVDFMRQALPTSNLENMVIPIGVIAPSGKEITFTAEALNIPDGLNVYLEDRQNNIFTKLNEENASYKVVLSEKLEGIGRFYMHTASKVLSTPSEILNSVSIFKTDNTNIKIAGLQSGEVSVKIFNILGKQVLAKSFTANGPENISLPNLASGIYIVQLKNDAGTLSKKIILE
ncbi:T9SS type A sorting domain-containing protein [Polaribacter sp.]|uniref:T9SS type A sorting domain-containing protein n=1 Tax=Polaribacter sp. TaxID=1920175 RepID=UPI003F6A979F